MAKSHLTLLVAALAGAAALGISWAPPRAIAAGPPIQKFAPDSVMCLQVTPVHTSGAPLSSLSSERLRCPAGETKTVGAHPDVRTAYTVPAGSRPLKAAVDWLGSGWTAKTPAELLNELIIAQVEEEIDALRDEVIDAIKKDLITLNDLKKFAKNHPKMFKALKILKKLSVYSWVLDVADFFGGLETKEFVFLNKVVEFKFPKAKFNLSLELDPGSLAGVDFKKVLWKTTVPVGDPLPDFIGYDTPILAKRTDLGVTEVRGNPGSSGLYAMWSVLISEPDTATGLQNVVLTTSCKAVGGSQTDADYDCLRDAVDGNPADADQDDDGLFDGVEAGSGSSQTDADSDNDGRSDLEEMVAVDGMPTFPNMADSDGDGVSDGGLVVDANNDGVPDFKDLDGDDIGDADACTSNLDTAGDGSSHRVCGWQVVEAHEGDNCPVIGNSSQTNTDASLPGGDASGDECDADSDQDLLVDYTETEDFYWDITDRCQEDGSAEDIAHGGSADDDLWKDSSGGLHSVTSPALDPTNPDTDADGYLDGAECLLGSNPTSASSTPGFPAVGDLDRDGLNAEQERFWRTGVVSGTVNEDVDGDGPAGCSTTSPASCGFNDVDSDGDGLKDRMEATILGTSPFSVDSDNDGINDPNETFPGSECGLIAYGNAHVKEFSVTRMGFEDLTVPWWDGGPTECGVTWRGFVDGDGDGLVDTGEPTGANCAGVITRSPDLDVTFDDDLDGNPSAGTLGGTDTSGDNGTPTDTDGDGQIDGAECNPPNGGVASNPLSSASRLTLVQCGPSASLDTDLDGLLDRWENCKWGTNPAVTDTDGDGVGDCDEVLDVDGNKSVQTTGDFLAIANVHFKSGTTGKDGVYDLDGNNSIQSTGDFLASAARIFGTGGQPCL